MKQKQELVYIKDDAGTLIKKKLKFSKVQKKDLKLIFKVFDKWMDTNSIIEELDRRKINFPECISEIVLVYIYKFAFLKQGSISYNGASISTSFDCFDCKTGDKIQIKASSIKNDLSSFGPECFKNPMIVDRLFFLDFSTLDKTFTVYEIPFKYVCEWKVNENETAEEVGKSNKRPRLSLHEIIEEYNIKGTSYELQKNDIVEKA